MGRTAFIAAWVVFGLLIVLTVWAERHPESRLARVLARRYGPAADPRWSRSTELYRDARVCFGFAVMAAAATVGFGLILDAVRTTRLGYRCLSSVSRVRWPRG